jgi:hypothetical protein
MKDTIKAVYPLLKKSLISGRLFNPKANVRYPDSDIHAL